LLLALLALLLSLLSCSQSELAEPARAGGQPVSQSASQSASQLPTSSQAEAQQKSSSKLLTGLPACLKQSIGASSQLQIKLWANGTCYSRLASQMLYQPAGAGNRRAAGGRAARAARQACS